MNKSEKELKKIKEKMNKRKAEIEKPYNREKINNALLDRTPKRP